MKEKQMSETNETPTEPEEIEALREGFQKPESKLSELLPCPFCGGKAHEDSDGGEDCDSEWFSVGCDECQFDVQRTTMQEAAACWNTRPAVKLPEKPSELCEWNEDASGDYYNTGCGNAHCFIEGGVGDNRYCFCPYCGKQIVQAALEKEGL